MTAEPVGVAEADFRSASACARESGVSRIRLYRASVVGDVRVRLLPGRPPLYSLADARQLAARGPEREIRNCRPPD